MQIYLIYPIARALDIGQMSNINFMPELERSS